MNTPMTQMRIGFLSACVSLAATGMWPGVIHAQNIYQSSMKGDPRDRFRVAGLGFHVQGSEWPGLLLPGGVVESGTYQGKFPKPTIHCLGRIHTGGTATLKTQDASWTSNSLRYASGPNAELKLTVTRLSPAILLQTDKGWLWLFGSGQDPAHVMKVQHRFVNSGPHRGRMKRLIPGGAVKPLRWATRLPSGKIRTGVLGAQPEVSLGMDGVQRVPSRSKGTARPPLSHLAKGWLLLWYGSDSVFLDTDWPCVYWKDAYGNQPSYHTPYWPKRDQVYQADIAILLLPEKAPDGLRFDTERGIGLTFGDGMGKMAVLPLAGHKPLKA